MFKSQHRSTAGRAGTWVAPAAGFLVLLALLLYPTFGSDSGAGTMTTFFILASAAMALNLMFGYAGQLSLGHSVFFGIGSYSTAVLVSKYGWSPWATFVVAFALAFVAGLLLALPGLRIRGIYLGLVTLAFALVFPNLLRWQKLAWLTSGSAGIQDAGFDFRSMPRLELFGLTLIDNLRSITGKTTFFYWLALLTALVVYLACRGLVHSRVGRALVAVRDNETAATTMGVNVATTKALVIATSAGLCALAGSVAAIRTGNVTAESTYLTFQGAMVFLIAVILGGVGTLWGPIIGAGVYIIISDQTGSWANDENIPAILRPVFGWAEIPPGNGIFAVLLILLMFAAPRGLAGIGTRIKEAVLAYRTRDAAVAPSEPARARVATWQRK